MTDELKPFPLCPLCGEKPTMFVGEGPNRGLVRCSENGCPLAFADWFPPEKWTTRPLEDALRAENEHLTETCQSVSRQLWEACRENNKLSAKLEAAVELVEAQAALITAMTVVLEPPSYETAGLLTPSAVAVQAARDKLETTCPK